MPIPGPESRISWAGKKGRGGSQRKVGCCYGRIGIDATKATDVLCNDGT